MTTLKDLLQESERMFDEKFVKIGEFGVVQIPPEIVKPFLDQKLRSAYRAGELAGEWKSFETAPKDREILVIYPNQGNVKCLVNWDVIHKTWESKGEPKPGLENQGCLWIDTPALHALREEDKV